ncbi:hypothetical protein Hanom_Chr11g01051321 [Helianthus anomalus]
MKMAGEECEDGVERGVDGRLSEPMFGVRCSKKCAVVTKIGDEAENERDDDDSG